MGFNTAFIALASILAIIAAVLQWFFPFDHSVHNQKSKDIPKSVRRYYQKRLDATYSGKSAIIMRADDNLVGRNLIYINMERTINAKYMKSN